jgi:hypothetical protein
MARGAPRFSCLSLVVASVLITALVVAGVVVTLKFEQRRDLKHTDELALEHTRHWADVVAGEMDAGASPTGDSLNLVFFEVKVRVVTLNRAPGGITGIVKSEERRTTTFGHSTVYRCFTFDIPAKAPPAGRFTLTKSPCPPVFSDIGGT